MNSAPRRETPRPPAVSGNRPPSRLRTGGTTAGPAVLPFAADEAQLTVAEIDDHVDRLARDLTVLGAGPGEAVAVALPRSPGLVLALVAVMRTGAVHLALDPEHPDRLARALAHTPPVCAICAPDAAERVSSLVRAVHMERNIAARPSVRTADRPSTGRGPAGDRPPVMRPRGGRGHDGGVHGTLRGL